MQGKKYSYQIKLKNIFLFLMLFLFCIFLFQNVHSLDSFDYDSIYDNIISSGNCENEKGSSDFMVVIPPNGCQPSVVRSDLLADQNAPVFCQLEIVKLNPLIESASVSSISFQGEYPEEVAGISFHPSRAAIKNYNSIADDSLFTNIGYVVILLKKQPNETNMEDWVSGMLTANIKYDYQKTYGIGQSNFYLDMNDNSDWENEFHKNNFWSGRGYLRLKNVGSNSATIEILKNKDRVYKKVVLNEDETSDTIYFPGDFCKAGFRLKLNEVVAANDEILLNINGDSLWVREGSRIINDRCVIRDINLDIENEKTVKIDCPGNSFTLKINISSEKNLVDLSEKNLENVELEEEYLEISQNNLNDLLQIYPYEKNKINKFFGEQALLKQIEISFGYNELHFLLIDKFLELYPESLNYEYVKSLQEEYLKYDYSFSENSFKLNNKNYIVSFRDFNSVEDYPKNAVFNINDVSVGQVNEGWSENYDEGVLTLKLIEDDYLIFELENDDKINTLKIFEGDEKFFENTNLRVYVNNINTVRTAHVTLLPMIESDYSKANFSFKIGIEKRNIKISPDVAQERIERLEKQIESLDNFIEKFDNVLSAWKGTCVTTSAILNAKAFISGFSGDGIARKEIMKEYRTICDQEISSGEKTYRTREGCYFEKAQEIESNVESYSDGISKVNEQIKEVQKGYTTKEGFLDSGYIEDKESYIIDLKKKITNPNIDKNNLNTVTKVRNALLYQQLLRDDSSCSSIACISAKEDYEESIGVFSKKGEENKASSRGTCSNVFLNPQVRYYDNGKNKGLPSIVPFGLDDGWYVYVSDSSGSLLEDEVKSYSTSGDVNYFYICNVGENGLMEYLSGDDLCQGFSNLQRSYDSFISCPDLSSSEVSNLYNDAKDAIVSAIEQADKNLVIINGEYFEVGQTMAETTNYECTDFMSVKDCKLLFNVCDPVLCPSSRCDAGGKYPVSNVAQQGIIGSIVLCWPNKDEGIKVPVCLTGINAGLQNLNSVLKQTQDCLQTSIDTGEYVGVCDAITSVYFCNLFWEQSSLMMDTLTSTSSSLVNRNVRGGGEYLFAKENFENLKSSVSSYLTNYGDELVNSFEIQSTEAFGIDFCNNFIGVDLPSKIKNSLGILSEPESPPQFNAHFSESLYEDVSSPSRSQYKVTYQVYAGENSDLRYNVYLKNPPISYIDVDSTYEVDSGYLEAGDGKVESLSFIAVSGYSTLCVNINGEEQCGFGSVTSNFAGEYLKEKYLEREVSRDGINSEKECISSGNALFELDGQNIELSGITRICANDYPDGNTNNNNYVTCEDSSDCSYGYNCNNSYCEKEGIRERKEGKWLDVGYCGNQEIRCWLDVDSIEEDFNAINVVGNRSVLDSVTYGDSYEEILKDYKNVKELLLDLREKIEKLSNKNLESIFVEKENILSSLDKIIGVEGDHTGQGTNTNKAEALFLKVNLFQIIFEKSRDITLEDISSNLPKASDKDEFHYDKDEESSEASKKQGWYLVNNNIHYNGESIEYFIDQIGEDKYLIISENNIPGGRIVSGRISIDEDSLRELEDYTFDGENFVKRE